SSDVTSPQSAPSCHVPSPTTLTSRPRRSIRRCSMDGHLDRQRGTTRTRTETRTIGGVRRRHVTTALAAAGALNTANAVRPLGWGTVNRAIPSFALGLATSEPPLQVLGAQAAAALALRGSGTPLSRALTAASWAGLVKLELEARRSPAVLEAALQQ